MGDPRLSQDPPTDLGRLVRMYLMKKGISLKDLAEALHTSYQNLFAILSGKTRLTLSMAKTIASLLDLSVDELAEAEGKGIRLDLEKESRQDREKGGQQGLGMGDEGWEPDIATEAPLQSMSQRRQHALLRSSQPSFQSSAGRPTISEYSPEREADQLVFRLLQMIEEDRVPGYFFRILAERLKPYLAKQDKEKQPREE